MKVRIPISSLIYPRECLHKTISAYAGLCHVTIREENSAERECGIEIEVLERTDHDNSRVVHEFLNYLLDMSMEHHLA